MRKQKGFTLNELLFVIILLFGILGWTANVVKLAGCDFKPSYKAEVIRVVGVAFFPLGMVTGYLNIDGCTRTDKS